MLPVERPLANFSNSALVMTVWQSPGEVFAAAEAGFAVPVLAAAVFGIAGQTPLTVMTGALDGTEAELSGGADGLSGIAPPGACPIAAGGGAPCGACAHTRVAKKTHTSQLLRICRFLQN